MSSVGSAVSSALTPAGSNARADQQNQQLNASNTLGSALHPLAQMVNQQQGWYANQMPGFQNAVQQLGQFATSGGRQQMAQANQNMLHGQALSQAANTYGQFAGNPSLAQAFGLNAANNANQAGGQYVNQINSPQGLMSAIQNYGQGLQMAAPQYGQLQGLAGQIINQQPFQVQQSPLAGVASLAGTASGMGWQPF